MPRPLMRTHDGYKPLRTDDTLYRTQMSIRYRLDEMLEALRGEHADGTRAEATMDAIEEIRESLGEIEAYVRRNFV